MKLSWWLFEKWLIWRKLFNRAIWFHGLNFLMKIFRFMDNRAFLFILFFFFMGLLFELTNCFFIRISYQLFFFMSDLNLTVNSLWMLNWNSNINIIKIRTFFFWYVIYIWNLLLFFIARILATYLIFRGWYWSFGMNLNKKRNYFFMNSTRKLGKAYFIHIVPSVLLLSNFHSISHLIHFVHHILKLLIIKINSFDILFQYFFLF